MSVRQVLQDFWAGHSAGDRDALKRVLAEDFTWTVEGNTSPVCGTLHGWEGFFGLLDVLANTFVPGTLDMQLQGLYADEEQGVGVIIIREAADLHNGTSIDQVIVDVITVRDGRIVEVREVLDLAETNRAFGFETPPAAPARRTTATTTQEENHG